MQSLATMLFPIFLALGQTIVAAQSNIDYPAADNSPTIPTTTSPLNPILTHLGTVYVVAGYPTAFSSDNELEMEKRDSLAPGVDSYVEATVVITTVPPALSAILSPPGSSTEMTVLKDGTTAPAPGPSGSYGTGTSPGINPGDGSGSGPGSGPGSSPGSGTGSSPSSGSGTGPGGDTGSNPTGSAPGGGTGSGPGTNPGGSGPGSSGPGSSGPGSSSPGSGPDNGPGSGTGNGGEPDLPSGAYGQPPNTAGQQPSSPTGEQSPNPAGQQSPNPTVQQSPNPAGQQSPGPTVQQSPNPIGQQPSGTEGQQPPNPTGGQPQNPGPGQSPNPTGGQSPNPAGQQSPNPFITNPGVTVTTVPLLGTVVETVTVSLESAPGNNPFPTSPTTEIIPTTFVTVQASSSLSTPCESDTTPWGLLSAPTIPALPTTFVTVPGGPAPIFATPSNSGNTPSTVVVTVPGTQGPLSAPAPSWNPTISNVPGWSPTPNAPGWATAPSVPGWATLPGTTITVPSSLQSGLSSTVPQLLSSTCTTAKYTNVISASTDPSTSTAAATMAAGSSVSPQHTTQSSETFGITTHTAAPIPITNAGVSTVDLNLSVICGVITLAFITGIASII
ncbi:hypothetical protein GGS24DRAFT_510824 [Hypoxylon argillaceum]|nr:hypothetical protein GGS24DRAFT_510824 [Hypoxylon argillaceum]